MSNEPAAVTPALTTRTVGAFHAELAAKQPAPGGGAASAMSAALAASLARMVLAYSIGKKSLAEHEPSLREADDAIARAIDVLHRLADEDAQAFAHYSSLDDDAPADERRVAIETAAAVPVSIAATAGEVLRHLEAIEPHTNKLLAADLVTAVQIAAGAARGAAEIALSNRFFLEKEGASTALIDGVLVIAQHAAERAARITKARSSARTPASDI